MLSRKLNLNFAQGLLNVMIGSPKWEPIEFVSSDDESASRPMALVF